MSWTEGVSQPIYGVKVEKRARVVMRDGVHLSVDVFRPESDGRFPALLTFRTSREAFPPPLSLFNASLTGRGP